MTQQRSVGVQRLLALVDLDQAAGHVRSRHITGSPGQEMVYATKLSQAQAYLAAQPGNGRLQVPAYIAADMAVDGTSAVTAAQAIVQAAAAFHDGPGPAIEQARRQGKAAIRAATTADGVRQALDAAIAALGEI